MLNPKRICLRALRMKVGKREKAPPFDIRPGGADV